MTNPNKSYEVDTIKLTCTCPAFIIRNRGQGLCKHIIKALEDCETKFNLNNLIEFIKEDNDALHFINKFGEETLDHLKTTGEVFENKGRIVIL